VEKEKLLRCCFSVLRTFFLFQNGQCPRFKKRTLQKVEQPIFLGNGGQTIKYNSKMTEESLVQNQSITRVFKANIISFRTRPDYIYEDVITTPDDIIKLYEEHWLNTRNTRIKMTYCGYNLYDVEYTYSNDMFESLFPRQYENRNYSQEEKEKWVDQSFSTHPAYDSIYDIYGLIWVYTTR
jgi:hypothetical protein